MITCDGLVKIYKSDEVEVVALQGLNIKLTPVSSWPLSGTAEAASQHC